LSYADLYTLSGVVAVEEAGGPAIPFRLGRADFYNGDSSPPDGRLPDADKGSKVKTTSHIRDIFYRMGFNDREIVALSGAHSLGRCHTDASGYWGPWTFAENTLSNEYFRLLVEERWSQKLTHNGKIWDGPDQYEDATGQLMMLPSDIALIQDPKFKEVVELYAKDEDAFFKDFAKAFSKLLELGVPFPAVKSWWQFW
jgi:cytochrome c peroxidase